MSSVKKKIKTLHCLTTLVSVENKYTKIQTAIITQVTKEFPRN